MTEKSLSFHAVCDVSLPSCCSVLDLDDAIGCVNCLFLLMLLFTRRCKIARLNLFVAAKRMADQQKGDENKKDQPPVKKQRVEGTASGEAAPSASTAVALLGATQSTVGAVVLHSTHGKELTFSEDDLVMPEAFLQSDRRQWYEAQWESMKSIWMRRALVDKKLQQMSLPEFIEDMAGSLNRRLQLKKEAKKEHNKQKKLKRQKEQTLLAAERRGCEPSDTLALTNVGPAEEFTDAALVNDLCDDIVEEMKKFGPVAEATAASNPLPTAVPPEDILGLPIPDETVSKEHLWDDRFFVLVRFGERSHAVAAQAAVHRQLFDGRYLKAVFYHPSPSPATPAADEEQGAAAKNETAE